jgi:hypothetical protein
MAKRGQQRELTARERFWLGHLRRIEAQGIETKAYGAQRGLSVHALYQARKRLVALGAWPERKAPARTASVPVFAPVRILDVPEAAVACRVRLASGAVVEWSSAPAADALAAVLARAAIASR